VEGELTGAAPPAHLEPFARACLEGRLLRLAYRSARGAETVRDVTVLGLAFRGGTWIAACHCPSGNALRAFRLDRVLATWPGEPAPPYEGGFDGRAFAAGALQEPYGTPPIRIAIRVGPPLAEVVGALLPGLSEVAPDGDRVVHLQAARPEAAVALALSLGSAAEVVHPPELARVARRLRARAAAGGTGPRPSPEPSPLG